MKAAMLLMISALSLVLMLGCGSRELTRSKAKELVTEKLKKEPPVPGRTAFAISVGKLAGGKATNLQQVLADKSQNARFWKSLADSGMIKVDWLGIEPINENGASGKNAFVDVSLTPAGSALKVTEAGGYVVIKACERIIQDVTGISSTGNASAATIEYTWQYGNLTPFVKAIREIYGSTLCDATTQKGHASFRRFNDGWRIEEHDQLRNYGHAKGISDSNPDRH